MLVQKKLTTKEKTKLTSNLVVDTVAWAELVEEQLKSAADYRDQVKAQRERIIEVAKLLRDGYRMVDAEQGRLDDAEPE